jgi:hypothetical protein
MISSEYCCPVRVGADGRTRNTLFPCTASYRARPSPYIAVPQISAYSGTPTPCLITSSGDDNGPVVPCLALSTRPHILRTPPRKLAAGTTHWPTILPPSQVCERAVSPYSLSFTKRENPQVAHPHGCQRTPKSVIRRNGLSPPPDRSMSSTHTPLQRCPSLELYPRNLQKAAGKWENFAGAWHPTPHPPNQSLTRMDRGRVPPAFGSSSRQCAVRTLTGLRRRDSV